MVARYDWDLNPAFSQLHVQHSIYRMEFNDLQGIESYIKLKLTH